MIHRTTNRMLRGLLLLALCLVMLSGLLASPSATAAPASTPVPSISVKVPKLIPYAIKSGILFNKPAAAKGTRKQQYVFTNKVVKALDATPRGARVDISTFSHNVSSVESALERAHRRGVIIQFHTWSARPSAQVDRLKRVLGTNTGAKSYVKVCAGSCLLNGSGGIQHAKAVTISKIVTYKKGKKIRYAHYITFIGSANFTRSNAANSWNNTKLIVGNKKIYVAVTKYVYSMRLDKSQRKFPAVVSGTSTAYFFPQRKLSYDPVLHALNKTTCKAPKGTGRGGRTVVRVIMFDFTNVRDAIAKRLVKLRKSGCNVAVILNGATIQSGVYKILLKGKVRLWNGYSDLNKDGKHDTYQHNKTVIIDGKVAGHAHRYVFTGSGNLTGGSITRNSEIILRLAGTAYVVPYEANFQQLLKYSSRTTRIPVYPPPANPAARKVQANHGTLVADDDSGMSEDE